MGIREDALAAARKENERTIERCVQEFRSRLKYVVGTEKFEVEAPEIPYHNMTVRIDDMVFVNNGYPHNPIVLKSYKGFSCEETVYNPSSLGHAISRIEEKMSKKALKSDFDSLNWWQQIRRWWSN